MGKDNSESGRNPSEEWLEEMKAMNDGKKYRSSTGTDLEFSWAESSSGAKGEYNTVTGTVSEEQSPRKTPGKIEKFEKKFEKKGTRENLSQRKKTVMSGSQLDGEESKSKSLRKPVSPLRGK
jgi:hypothetical protein